MTAKNRRTCHVAYARPEGLVDEPQTRNRDLVARGRDDMINLDHFVLTGALLNGKTHSAILGVRSGKRRAQMHGHAADDRIANEPTRRWAKVAIHHSKAQRLRHCVKNHGDVGTHARAPADAKTRARRP